MNNTINKSKCNFNILMENVGRIDKNQKYQLNLIKAFNKLKAINKNCEIKVIGRCYSESRFKYKSEILKYISNKNLDNMVTLLGEIKNIFENY